MTSTFGKAGPSLRFGMTILLGISPYFSSALPSEFCFRLKLLRDIL